MAHQTYYHATTLPINMTAKSHYYNPAPKTYRTASISPPEIADSSTSSSAVPSYSNSNASSYGGSTNSEYDSSAGGSSIDLMDLLNNHMGESFDPVPLDRNLVKQAQTSGALNAKQRELAELQAKAQARLASFKSRAAEFSRDSQQVTKDLEWTQKRVSAMTTKAQKKHAAEYKQARGRVPSPGL